MNAGEYLFDLTLAALLVLLAAAALHASRLYLNVVLFIAFGLVLALCWARLGAPDLALAEAALGAGLTGALLLNVLSRRPAEPQAIRRRSAAHSTWVVAGSGTLLVLTVMVLVFWPVLPTLLQTVPEQLQRLPTMVAGHLPQSGVAHPVTAVLLNYRAWDTLLELVVLLLALLGVRQLRLGARSLPAPWPLLQGWARLLAPLAVLIGGYLLWRGAHAPGGAFQAGAVLAAGAVTLRLCQWLPPICWQRLWVRGLIVSGLLVFLLAGTFSVFWGHGWLAYPPAWAGVMILLIEVSATASIATILTLLVLGEDKELQA